MYKFLSKVFVSLWPPAAEKEPAAWRWAVFFALILVGSALGLHLAAAKGFLSPLGISAVADERTVNQIIVRQGSILYAIYAPQIRILVRQRCFASSVEEKENASRQIDLIARDYLRSTGRTFPLPRCSEV